MRNALLALRFVFMFGFAIQFENCDTSKYPFLADKMPFQLGAKIASAQ